MKELRPCEFSHLIACVYAQIFLKQLYTLERPQHLLPEYFLLFCGLAFSVVEIFPALTCLAYLSIDQNLRSKMGYGISSQYITSWFVDEAIK